MVDRNLGEATIVYEDPADGTVERTVQNEHIAHFQDHWTVKTGEDEQGNDTVRRIPREQVYYVERSVTAFEEEVQGIRQQVESVADEIRSRLPGQGRNHGGGGRDSVNIEVESENESGSGDM
jgi:hypothetical protein